MFTGGERFSLAPGDREAHFGNRGMPDTTTCMAKAGFDYPEPMAAAISERWKTDEPTPAERATARADVACQRSSKHAGYHGAKFSLAPDEREPDFRNVGEPDGSHTFH
ncbi:hypothetical protein [Streptomyces sp. NRRL S-1813]|uniref:hypothetical protein n=1 Tax=Streptomyces sp. NRRL S-1813 TaxID=1463888 RepID=UPI0004CC6295|nr:hypothetical protein [Streptomyces sp. NRRL S-1813]